MPYISSDNICHQSQKCADKDKNGSAKYVSSCSGQENCPNCK